MRCFAWGPGTFGSDFGDSMVVELLRRVLVDEVLQLIQFDGFEGFPLGIHVFEGLHNRFSHFFMGLLGASQNGKFLS